MDVDAFDFLFFGQVAVVLDCEDVDFVASFDQSAADFIVSGFASAHVRGKELRKESDLEGLQFSRRLPFWPSPPLSYTDS